MNKRDGWSERAVVVSLGRVHTQQGTPLKTDKNIREKINKDSEIRRLEGTMLHFFLSTFNALWFLAQGR